GQVAGTGKGRPAWQIGQRRTWELFIMQAWSSHPSIRGPAESKPHRNVLRTKPRSLLKRQERQHGIGVIVARLARLRPGGVRLWSAEIETRLGHGGEKPPPLVTHVLGPPGPIGEMVENLFRIVEPPHALILVVRRPIEDR